MNLPNDATRCLGRGCDKPDQCARHRVMRHSVSADTTPVEYRVCGQDDNIGFMPINKEGSQ